LETEPLKNQVVKCVQIPSTLDKTLNDYRHLIAAEVEKLLSAAKGSRYESRNH